MIETIPSRDGLATQLLIRPNHSLTTGRLLLALGSIALIVAVVGLYFFSLGAWLVLPFSGLEILLILFVAREITQHAGDFELIEIDSETVGVTHRQRGHIHTNRFQRYWLQVELRHEPGRSGGAQRLYLRSHGRECEIGQHLCEPDRLALAERLCEIAESATGG